MIYPLQIYNSLQKTNNCCEVYHMSLKSLMRVKKPNIWAFMECFEKNLIKYDLEFQRLKNGLEIGGRSKKSVKNERQRLVCKDKLQNRDYPIVEYLNKISDTIGAPNIIVTLKVRLQTKVAMMTRIILMKILCPILV